MSIDYRSQLQLLHDAFLRFKNKHNKIHWKDIVTELNKKGGKDYFGYLTAVGTSQRRMGIGGEEFKNSLSDGRTVTLEDYKNAIIIVKAASAVAYSIYHHSIKLTDQKLSQDQSFNEPQYTDSRNFVLVDEHNKEIKETSKDKKFYDMYYWSYNNGIQKGVLSIDDEDKAELIVNYQEENEHRLIGEITKINGLQYINLFDPLKKKTHPKSQFVLREGNQKDNVFFSCYSTGSRSDPSMPLSGIVIFYKRSEKSSEQSDDNLIKDFATFNLYGKRLNVRNPSFNLKDEIKKLPVNTEHNVFTNSLLSFTKISKTFTGFYEGYLVNPVSRIFENFMLTIEASGEIKLLYKACIHTYYKGIARLVGDVLILKYDYQNQYRIYRIEMMLNITSFDGLKNEKASGNYMGFPRHSFITQASGKVVILKRSSEVPDDIMTHWQETESLKLSKPNDNKKALTLLKSKKIIDDFQSDFK